MQTSCRPRHTYSYALPHDAGLLHPAGPPELLHVLAEVALSALCPQTRLALAASRPPPPRSRRAPVGRELDGRGSAQLPLGPPHCPVLEETHTHTHRVSCTSHLLLSSGDK